MATLPELRTAAKTESDWTLIKSRMNWWVDKSTGEVVSQMKTIHQRGARCRSLFQCAVALGVLKDNAAP